MNLETKITIYKFTPQVFTLTLFRLSSFLVGIIFYTREVLLTHSFHLKRISVGNRRKSIACVINKNERNLASTI